MTSCTQTHEPMAKDRCLVVAEPDQDVCIAPLLRERYADWEIETCESYLSGIAQLCASPARAVIAWIDGDRPDLDDMVGGLREAAGDDATLLVSCAAEYEPLARRATAMGADDYLLYPLAEVELDRALGYDRGDPWPDDWSVGAVPDSAGELIVLAGLLEHLDAAPRTLLRRAAELVARAVGAASVRIVVDGAAVNVGAQMDEPVLAVPLITTHRRMGHVALGPPNDRPYTPATSQKLEHYAAVLANVFEAAARHRRWFHLAMTDELSGLPNRRAMRLELDRILEKATQNHFPVTLLIFDVDNLKTYNDAYGHETGDHVIRLAGDLFRRHCRDHDVVARLGGDEFGVVFWDPEGPRKAGSHHPGSALAVLKRYTEALQKETVPHLGALGRGCLTISGGLATFPWDAKDAQELICRADEALLAAKRAGKNRILLVGETSGGCSSS